MELAHWLKLRMNEKDVNALGLSYAINVSHVTIGKWLKGTYVPKPTNCRKLAAYFGVPEDHVLSIAGHRKLPESTGDLAEPRPVYRTGPRADLARLLDRLTDDQILALLKFLESLL